MKKLLLSTCLAASILCSAAVPSSFAIDLPTSSAETQTDADVVATFFSNMSVESTNGYFNTDTFVVDSKKGNIIHIYYKNKNKLSPLDSPISINLYRRSENEGNVPVMNAACYDEIQRNYVVPNNESGTYFVNIVGSPDTFGGYLTVEQVDSSEQAELPFKVFPFTDVSANAWYRRPVEYVYEKGLFSGTSETTFSPELDITRAQIVAVLGNMHQKLTGETIEADTPDFSDVPENAYYAKYVDWAKENGIVAGFTDGKFHPNDIITREQFAVIVNKYIQVNGKTLDASHEYTPFTDEDQISNWAKDAVVNMVKYGFMSGKTENQFAPKDSVIRAESATVIADLHKTLV